MLGLARLIGCMIAIAALALRGAQTDAQTLAVAEPQHRHARLMHHLDDAGQERPVKTPADWQHRREQILAGMQEAMGPFPMEMLRGSPAPLPATRKPVNAPLDVQVLETTEQEGVPRQNHFPRLAQRRAGHRLCLDPQEHSRRQAPRGDARFAPDRRARQRDLRRLRQGQPRVRPRTGPARLHRHRSRLRDLRRSEGTRLREGRLRERHDEGIVDHIRCVDYLQAGPTSSLGRSASSAIRSAGTMRSSSRRSIRGSPRW